MSNNDADKDCVDELCEATEGLNAFCEAITDDGKRKRCIGIMDLLKEGKMDTDTAREKLAEELGKDGYMEGATGLRGWISNLGKEEPQIEEPAPIEEVEEIPPVPVVVDVPMDIPVSLELSPIEPLTEKEVEELDESISEPELESEPEPLPEVEKVPEVQPEPVEPPSDDEEQPQSEQSEE